MVTAQKPWRSIGLMLLASSRQPSRPRISSTTAITAMIRARVRACLSASATSDSVISIKLLKVGVDGENVFDRPAQRARQLEREQGGRDEDAIFHGVDGLAADRDQFGESGLGESGLGANREQPIVEPLSHI